MTMASLDEAPRTQVDEANKRQHVGNYDVDTIRNTNGLYLNIVPLAQVLEL